MFYDKSRLNSYRTLASVFKILKITSPMFFLFNKNYICETLAKGKKEITRRLAWDSCKGGPPPMLRTSEVQER